MVYYYKLKCEEKKSTPILAPHTSGWKTKCEALPLAARVWYKQWKVRRGCLEKFARGTSRGKFFQTIPENFPLFVRLWASKTEEGAAQS